MVDEAESTSGDEDQIRELMNRWRKALRAKDVDRLTADYAEDVLLFDACPPYKTQGVAGIRNVWQNPLPHFPEQFETEHRDIQIHADG